MKRKFFRMVCALALTVAAQTAFGADFDTGMLPADHISLPDEPPSVTIFLFSDARGWTPENEATSKRLVDDGAAVVGVDLPAYLDTINKDDGDCVYLVSDIEELSHQVMRAGSAEAYHPPLLAGAGAGGGMVMSIAAQTPAATVGGTLAVDPTVTFPAEKTLCSGAPRHKVAAGTVYDLAKGNLPDPLSVTFTPAASQDSRDHVADLQKRGFPLKVSESTETDGAAFDKALSDLVAAQPDTSDLPIVELPATPTRDTLAIIYSGDGGWRDIDKTIGSIFQAKGIPTVGMDSLRYFWSQKTAQQVADDLHEIIATYTQEWNVKNVLLVGYSFGADMLPSAYDKLSPEDRAKIDQVSLLGFSNSGSFEISVSGWLGASGGDGFPTLPLVSSLKPEMVQCFYGTDEDDTACPKLESTGVEVVKTAGGHHFDGDYDQLAGKILDGLARRSEKSADAKP